MGLSNIIDSEILQKKYNNIKVLGNGPSLKLLDFCKIDNDLIIGCNWLFDHENFNIIDSRCLVCFSDPSFKVLDPEKWIGILSQKKCYTLIPSSWTNIIEWSSKKKDFKSRVFIYNLNGSYKNYQHNDCKQNMINFPDLNYTSSVMTTVCLPMANNMKPKRISISGVDASYFKNGKFDPYFFKLKKLHKYRHSVVEAEKWSSNLNKELEFQLLFIKNNGILIQKD